MNNMHKTGYTLGEFNDDANGDGTGDSIEELFDNLGWIEAINEIFAQWTKNNDCETPVMPSGSSTSTNPSQATTADGAASYTVSGSTAKIGKVDVDKLVTDTDEKKTAEINLSGAKRGITVGGLLTDASEGTSTNIEGFLQNMKISC